MSGICWTGREALRAGNVLWKKKREGAPRPRVSPRRAQQQQSLFLEQPQQQLLFPHVPPPQQQHSRMMIRMIHRQLLLPLFHIVFHLTRLSLGYLMWEEGKKQLDRKNLFYA